METSKLISIITVIVILIAILIFMVPSQEQEQVSELDPKEFGNVTFTITVNPVEAYDPVTTNYRISLTMSVVIPATETQNINLVEYVYLRLVDSNQTPVVLHSGTKTYLEEQIDQPVTITETFTHSDFGDVDLTGVSVELVYKMSYSTTETVWGSRNMSGINFDIFDEAQILASETVTLTAPQGLDVSPIDGSSLGQLDTLDRKVPYKFTTYIPLFQHGQGQGTSLTKYAFYADMEEAGLGQGIYNLTIVDSSVYPNASRDLGQTLPNIKLIPFTLGGFDNKPIRSDITDKSLEQFVLLKFGDYYLRINTDDGSYTNIADDNILNSAVLNSGVTGEYADLSSFMFYPEDVRDSLIQPGTSFDLNPDGFTMVCFNGENEYSEYSGGFVDVPIINVYLSNSDRLLRFDFNEKTGIDYGSSYSLLLINPSDHSDSTEPHDFFYQPDVMFAPTTKIYAIFTRDYSFTDTLTYKINCYYGDVEIFDYNIYYGENGYNLYLQLPNDLDVTDMTYTLENNQVGSFFNEPADWTTDNAFKRFIKSRPAA